MKGYMEIGPNQFVPTPAAARIAEMEERHRLDDLETAEKNLDQIEKALRWLWDYLPPEVIDNPPAHFEDEDVYHFVMQTLDELDPWFNEIRAALEAAK